MATKIAEKLKIVAKTLKIVGKSRDLATKIAEKPKIVAKTAKTGG